MRTRVPGPIEEKAGKSFSKLNVGELSVTTSKSNNVPNLNFHFSKTKGVPGVQVVTDILKIDPASLSFFEGVLEVFYGTRIHPVSNSVSAPVKKLFGFNKFNGGQVAVTATSILQEDANSAAHTPVSLSVIGTGATAHLMLQVTFSATLEAASFVWGYVKVASVETVPMTIY